MLKVKQKRLNKQKQTKQNKKQTKIKTKTKANKKQTKTTDGKPQPPKQKTNKK
jgi:hypothetical protein